MKLALALLVSLVTVTPALAQDHPRMGGSFLDFETGRTAGGL